MVREVHQKLILLVNKSTGGTSLCLKNFPEVYMTFFLFIISSFLNEETVFAETFLCNSSIAVGKFGQS